MPASTTLVRLCCAAFGILVSGCGSLATLSDFTPYSGVQRDLETAESNLSESSDRIAAMADLPISAIVDTVLLPLTFPVWVGSRISADDRVLSPDSAGAGIPSGVSETPVFAATHGALRSRPER